MQGFRQLTAVLKLGAPSLHGKNRHLLDIASLLLLVVLCVCEIHGSSSVILVIGPFQVSSVHVFAPFSTRHYPAVEFLEIPELWLRGPVLFSKQFSRVNKSVFCFAVT